MSLLTPLALLGLLTLPAILLLHLLHHRRQQLFISSLRLWLGLEQKKQGDRPRRIPLSLMLLLQLLIALALTLGLARPALSFLLRQPQHTVFILDTTTSMLAQDVSLTTTGPEAPRRFDLARQAIQQQLQTMTDRDSFVIITLNRRPEVLLAGEGSQQTQAIQALDNLTPGATGLDLPAALTLANGLLKPGRQNRILVFTDGNYPLQPESLPPLFAQITWQMIPPQPAAASNQALLNVSARTLPDGRHRLFARVVNYGPTPVRRTLQVMLGENLSATPEMFDELPVTLDPQAEIARVWTLPASARIVTVQIVEADVLPLDNRADLWLMAAPRRRVLLIAEEANGANEALRRALQAQPGLELTSISFAAMSNYLPGASASSATGSKQSSRSEQFDLIVFDGLPSTLTAWPAGNLLVVNPPLGHPLLSAQNFVRNLRPDPETASPLLNGVDLSGVYFNRIPRLTLPQWAEVDLMAVAASNQAAGDQADEPQSYPLIFHGTVNNTRLVVWAFDLAESNLSARLALPLLTDNTLTRLFTIAPPPVVPLGEPVLIGAGRHVKVPEGRRLFLPAQTGRENNWFTHTRQPGLYGVYNQNDELVGGFAVHAGSALESNLTVQFEPEATTIVSHIPAPVSPEVRYYEFWPWLAGLALVVVVIEGWLAWRR